LVCDEILTNIIRKIEEKLDVSKIIFWNHFLHGLFDYKNRNFFVYINK
jgi:hypothetical protein